MKEEGCIDRISSLPDLVLHHILSFVVSKDAVQFSAASKTLHHAWTTLPYLDLGYDFFHKLDNVDESEIPKERELLSAFVEQMLMSRINQGLSIINFRLSMNHLDPEFATHLDRWVHFLVESDIKELFLDAYPYRKAPLYDLPPILLFKSTSLQVLNLSKCNLPCAADIKLPLLRKLRLAYVFADEHTLRNILTSCCCLEDLELFFCHGFKRLEVSGMFQLRRLKVNRCAPIAGKVLLEEFVVEILNLVSLSYSGGCDPGKLSIYATPGCRLKRLVLLGVHITNKWFDDLISKLPFLEELLLANLSLKYIEISSSGLKQLLLYDLFNYNCHGVGEVKIDAPNLLSFKYRGSVSSVSLTSNLAVLEADISLHSRLMDDLTGGDSDFCSKLVQFLHKFDNSNVVKIQYSFFKELVVPLERRSSFVAPLPNIKHLELKGVFDKSEDGKSDFSIFPELMDSLLWMSPRVKILNIKDDDYDEPNPLDLSMKFYFGKSKGNEDECSTRIVSPWSSWRNSLTRLEYERKGADAEFDKCLSNFFFNNAKFLTEIVASHGGI